MKSITKIPRAEVYAAIDSERAYQDTLVRNDVLDQSPMEQLALIEYICAQMKADWYNNPGYPKLDYVRKIAGIAVRCMEMHGAPQR